MKSDISFENLSFAKQVAQRISASFLCIGPELEETLFYSKIRVKSDASVNEKLYRKRFLERKFGYSYRSISDIVGVRVVVLKDSDLSNAFDLLSGVLDLGLSGGQPIFAIKSKWNNLTGAELYGRPSETQGQKNLYENLHDHVTEKIISDMELGNTPERKIKSTLSRIRYHLPNKERYSSAHFNFVASGYSDNRVEDVTVEFQIRTAAEDIWSEINHKYLYKSNNPYIWTPKIQDTYRELGDDSFEFKNKIEDLSQIIDRFSKHSRDVNLIEKKFKIPRARAHSSLVFSLYYAMSGQFLTDPNGLLEQYERLIHKIRENFATKAFDEVCNEATSLLNLIDTEIDSDLQQDDLERTDTILLEQRKMLIQLEKIRINISRDLSSIRASQRSLQTGGAANETMLPNEVSASLINSYEQLCEYKNNADALIRPVSAISYWKYLCFKYINPEKALMYIRAANEELSHDDALPEWSIYRVLIPRRLARELQISIEKSTERNLQSQSDVDGGGMVGINAVSFYELERTLTEMFRFSLSSFLEILKEDARRGDLIFRSNEGKKLGDEVFLLYIVYTYFRLTGRSILDQDKDFLLKFPKVLKRVKLVLGKMSDADPRAIEARSHLDSAVSSIQKSRKRGKS